jgi:hypothetical protein
MQPSFESTATSGPQERAAIDRHLRGMATESQVWSDIPHSWFPFHDRLPEARRSIALAGSFVRGR